MIRQSSAQGSSGEGAILTEGETPKSSLLDSIFSSSQPRTTERRSADRDTPSVDPNRITSSRSQAFVPSAPKSLEEAGLTETEVEDLVLKFLFRRGVQAGRNIAEQLRLPFGILLSIFQALKNSQRIVIARNASVSDFEYSITGKGIESAKQCNERCSYFGSAPVPFADYVNAVNEQSMTRSRITLAQVEAALADLSVPTTLCTRIGKALVEAKAMFIYGAPGNGKTSIAERLTATYGDSIWIPRAIDCDGEIIRVFDHFACTTSCHSTKLATTKSSGNLTTAGFVSCGRRLWSAAS